MLVGLAVSTKAADGIVASDINIPQGGSAKLSVQLNNTVRDNYGGFQFELKLPAGISATSIEQAARLQAIEGYTLIINQTDATNNIYTVLGYNTSRTNISGTSGDIAYIILSDGTTSEVGSSMTGRLQNVVLSTTDATPLNIDAANTTFTITIAAPPANVILDENSTTAPEASVGAVNVTVNRSIKANSWSTICLPFAITAEKLTAAFGAGVEVKDFTSWSSTEDPGTGDIVGITIGFTSVTAMEANHPYLIKVANAITAEEGFTVDGVDIDPEDEPFIQVGKSKATRGYFTGTYVANTIVPEEALFVSNDKFYYSNGSTKMKAFRGYFELADVLTSVEGAAAHIMISDETTGVADVRSLISEDEGEYYSIAGQKVLNPQKGIYIKNGKKVIIK